MKLKYIVLIITSALTITACGGTLLAQPTVTLPTLTPIALDSTATLAPPTAIPKPSATATTISIVPIPKSTIQINGVSYTAFQMPGDPFRFVCQEPCTANPELFYAAYSGFRIVRERLIKVTGIDVLPELQPIDIHVLSDRWCGNSHNPLGPTNRLGASFTPHGNGFVCTFQFETVDRPEWLIQPERQWINLHEYFHEFFFGRIADGGMMHDIVSPISWNVTDFDPAAKDLCAFHPQTPYGDYGGYLIYELCRQNGFQPSQLASSLIELDKLYQSGGGRMQQGFKHLVPTIAQYRDILNRVLKSDTTKAFLGACWPASKFEEINIPATPTRIGQPSPTSTCTFLPSSIPTRPK